MIRVVIASFTVTLMLGACSHNSRHEPLQGESMKIVDFKNIQWYAQRASAAYKSKSQIKDLYPNTIRVTEVDDTEVQYFLEIDPETNHQIISIRGTANLKTALEDAEYIPIKNNKLNIYVHRGFNEDTIKLYADIHPHLNKTHPIYITGHSLGAAISTLLMMYLHNDGFNLAPSVNFGQPKVTNKKGVNTYNTLPLTRVLDENDVVPLVPPITLLDSIHGVYEHLGDEVILLEDEYYAYLNEHDAERASVGSFWENLGKESVKEHFMENYLNNIKSKLTLSKQVAYEDREHHTP